jgi:hypothetical protein
MKFVVKAGRKLRVHGEIRGKKTPHPISFQDAASYD